MVLVEKDSKEKEVDGEVKAEAALEERAGSERAAQLKAGARVLLGTKAAASIGKKGHEEAECRSTAQTANLVEQEQQEVPVQEVVKEKTWFLGFGKREPSIYKQQIRPNQGRNQPNDDSNRERHRIAESGPKANEQQASTQENQPRKGSGTKDEVNQEIMGHDR